MGVPQFYRWVASKYPRCVVDAVDQSKSVDNIGPLDCTLPNPNGMEFDNLYLDMNGIIHPCCHPEGKPQPTTEDEMIENVFEYVDHIMSIIRPRKILYMAIDGVAPRAKMNQQRARRFWAAKEVRINQMTQEKLREEWRKEGIKVPDYKAPWDSNVITPGTPFMARLSSCLHYFIHSRLQHNPAWQGLKVIFSDAKVPGEGEHKIMHFIRLQRAQPGYLPNTSHCLYGMDADLIMLGLASHDPYFTIIREKVDFEAVRSCNICGQEGHMAFECEGLAKVDEDAMAGVPRSAPLADFQFLHIFILREYLERDLYVPPHFLPFPYSFERLVDDFVFLCFFVGNDFLPHLPSLDIREGALDHLMEMYKITLPTLGGYITKEGKLSMVRVCRILQLVGDIEDIVLQERALTAQRQQQREERNAANSKRRREEVKAKGLEMMVPDDNRINGGNARKSKSDFDFGNATENGQSSTTSSSSSSAAGKRPEDFKTTLKLLNYQNSQIADVQDTIMLGTAGWKERYYKIKMDLDVPDKEKQHAGRVASEGGEAAPLDGEDNLLKTYAQGLAWVFMYYYRGCASWSWYFPYHYAPFASSLARVSTMDLSMEKSKPFSPMAQLMGVFPSSSAHCLPRECAALMTTEDSPIADFYPTDFKMDLNGKRFTWQAIALLPFIDEGRLLKELEACLNSFTPEEAERNSVGDTFLFVHASNPLATQCIIPLLYAPNSSTPAILDANQLAGPDPAASALALPNLSHLPPALPSHQANQHPSLSAMAPAFIPGVAAVVAGHSSAPAANLSAAEMLRKSLKKRAKTPSATPSTLTSATAATSVTEGEGEGEGEAATGEEVSGTGDAKRRKTTGDEVGPDNAATTAADGIAKPSIEVEERKENRLEKGGEEERQVVGATREGVQYVRCDPALSGGLTGKVAAYEGGRLQGSASSALGLPSYETIENLQVCSVLFVDPPQYAHSSELLPGLVPPQRTMFAAEDFAPSKRFRVTRPGELLAKMKGGGGGGHHNGGNHHRRGGEGGGQHQWQQNGWNSNSGHEQPNYNQPPQQPQYPAYQNHSAPHLTGVHAHPHSHHNHQQQQPHHPPHQQPHHHHRQSPPTLPGDAEAQRKWAVAQAQAAMAQNYLKSRPMFAPGVTPPVTHIPPHQLVPPPQQHSSYPSSSSSSRASSSLPRSHSGPHSHGPAAHHQSFHGAHHHASSHSHHVHSQQHQHGHHHSNVNKDHAYNYSAYAPDNRGGAQYSSHRGGGGGGLSSPPYHNASSYNRDHGYGNGGGGGGNYQPYYPRSNSQPTPHHPHQSQQQHGRGGSSSSSDWAAFNYGPPPPARR